ncbi:MAG: DMT family transporter [Burkholderiales bacterium]|nr:DMT family transporter [Burkholderiales bacterium]
MFGGIFLLALLGIDWASGYAIAGYCMTHGVSPYGYAFWQSFGPFIILLVIQFIRKDLWINKKGMVYALYCGIFGIVIPNLLIYIAAPRVPSSVLTVVANISPIITYVLAIVFGVEKFNLSRMMCVLLGMFGVLLIVFSGHGVVDGAPILWILFALLIPLSYAFSAVYISRFDPKSGNSLSYAMWMLLFSTLCISPITIFMGGYYQLKITDVNTLLILLEIVLSVVGYIILFIIIRKLGVVYYTLVNAVAVVSGVIYGKIVFNQMLNNKVYIGVAMILLAIAGVSYFKSTGKVKKD